MKAKVMITILAVAALILAAPQVTLGKGPGGGGPPNPGEDSAGNNLSYPVIWAEGVAKVLPGTPGADPVLNGEWWYQWGTNGEDPNVTPASCPPDPDESDLALNPDELPLCDDGQAGSVDVNRIAGEPPADFQQELAKAYLQKDQNNTWQAGSADWSAAPVDVHWIDWGDNLESVDWYTRSQVRTEVVLFQDLGTPMLEYEMRHTSGWGINEVHGAAATLDDTPAAMLGPGTRATVYSHCARFTIQKLLVERDDSRLEALVWVPEEGWTEPEPPYPDPPYPYELINPPMFNKSVSAGGDGPGFYSAEINVKGRIIYGYTWNVRTLNEGAGDYRLTFSFDQTCGTEFLNTFFADGVTQIIQPAEEEEPTAGGRAVLDIANNLTYMDIRILERGGGGGGGQGPKNPNR